MRKGQRGYILALPRLFARLAGGSARRAEWSAWEVYGFGVFVFAMACLAAGHALFGFVRPGPGRWLGLLLLPLVVWIAFLLLYYVNSLLARLLRRLGLYSARTNNPLQHFIIISLMTLLAGWMLEEGGWLSSLGILWLALLALNLLALLFLKILDET